MNWRGIVMKSNCMSKIQFLLIKPVENTTSVVEIERAFDEALYDDRLEITSPGMLLNNVTIEK